MSASAPDTSRTVLPFVPASRQALQGLLKQIAALEPRIITELQNQDEAELIRLWGELGELERMPWVVKCAISAAIWDRTAAAKRGRGNRDVGEVGILAAVSRTSKKVGVTPSTIYLNARIFRLIESVKADSANLPQGNSYTETNILDLLNEKGYWEHALNAADPVKATYEFADRKATLPRFKVTDAERLVLTEGMGRRVVAEKAVEQAREATGQLSVRQTLISHIRFAENIVKKQIIPNCTDPEFKERVWDELLMELKDEYQELFDEDACAALRLGFDAGARREDALVIQTGFPLPDVSRLMQVLADLGEYIRIQPRDVKQRSEFQLWHKVGTAFDNAKYLPMAKR